MSDWCLSERVLARWWHPVASSEALDLLYWAMHGLLYQRTAATMKMASFLGVFVDCCLFACCPEGRWGDTEWVVAQCRRPVASGVAPDMLHWAMRFVLQQRTAMAIKMANGSGICSYYCWFCHHNNHSQRPCYGPLKLKLRHSDVYYNVICLLLCFGLPPTTMDAVSATIVASGRANIN
jgi:hypothetical protein